MEQYKPNILPVLWKWRKRLPKRLRMSKEKARKRCYFCLYAGYRFTAKDTLNLADAKKAFLGAGAQAYHIVAAH